MVPCDLITELNPRDLLDAHRVYDPTFSALFYEPGSVESASKDDGNFMRLKKKEMDMSFEVLTVVFYKIFCLMLVLMLLAMPSYIKLSALRMMISLCVCLC